MSSKNITEKPITMVKEEFKKDIIDRINNSKMPLFLVEYIMKEVMEELHSAVEIEAKNNSASYNAMLKSSSKEKPEESK